MMMTCIAVAGGPRIRNRLAPPEQRRRGGLRFGVLLRVSEGHLAAIDGGTREEAR
jgi:hypothetical protein